MSLIANKTQTAGWLQERAGEPLSSLGMDFSVLTNSDVDEIGKLLASESLRNVFRLETRPAICL
jgi:hypothetical protein